MKRAVFILAGLAIVATALTGCQEPTKGNEFVEVFIEGGGRFPASLAGRWKSDEGGWEIVLEPDGTISSAVISFGRINVMPGQVTTVPMKEGGQGVVEPDLWTVQYSPEIRELAVEIRIKNFRMERGEDLVEGNVRDLLIGPVSEDGQSWRADWISYGDYIVTTSTHKEYKLPMDEGSEIKGSVLFTRVAEPD